MGIASCFLALIGGIVFARRSIGHGLGFVLSVGCVYGWLRANFLDGFTHFCFDAALLGLYASILPRLRAQRSDSRSKLTTWFAALMLWPLLIILLSPLLEAQHVFVQIAGLRNAVLFGPVLLIGGAANKDDFIVLGSWAEWCVIGTSSFALAEWIFGLEALYPVNEITKLIYASHDVGSGYYRLPASFTSAHAYGGTLVALLPLLIGRLNGPQGRRLITVAAIALASLGVFACGARSPVVLFGIVLGGTVLLLDRTPGRILLLVTVMAAVGYTVSQTDRLRRFETLSDSEMVEDRLIGSVNMSFVEILTEYPMGKGLGSAAGTSVPFFLADYARPPVGIENEFVRLLVEEGLPGLLLWVGFVLYVLVRSGTELRRRGATALGMWLVCATTWASGLFGLGLLASIPSTMLLMLYLGHLACDVPAEAESLVGTRRALLVSP